MYIICNVIYILYCSSNFAGQETNIYFFLVSIKLKVIQYLVMHPLCSQTRVCSWLHVLRHNTFGAKKSARVLSGLCAKAYSVQSVQPILLVLHS